MWIFLSIYLSGVIVAMTISGYRYYKGWYNGEPITLGNVIEITVIPLFSWAAVLAMVILYIYDISDKVMFKGRKKEE